MILVKLWSKEFENFAFVLSFEDMRSKKQTMSLEKVLLSRISFLKSSFQGMSRPSHEFLK